MIVKPSKPGLVIRDPKSRRPLPDEGARVSDTSYWRRRLLAGDVVELSAEEVKALEDAKQKARAEAKKAAEAAKATAPKPSKAAAAPVASKKDQ